MSARLATICVIPARGGSKGLPRKNVALLGGKPLIVHPIEAALACDDIDVVLVTTDDPEIASVAEAAGAVVPFVRPPELADDLATTEATLQHALLAYEESSGTQFDICVFLTATDVFRDPAWLGQAIGRLRDDDSLESVFVGHPTHKNYWHRNDSGHWERILPWMRAYSSRQVRQSIVREDTGLACASRSWLWREGRRIGDRVDIILNERTDSGIDIHGDEDLFLANALIERRRETPGPVAGP